MTPIPLHILFPREYAVCPADIRRNLEKPSGYSVDPDGVVWDDGSRKIVAPTRHYAGRDFVVLHYHDVDVVNVRALNTSDQTAAKGGKQ